MPRHRTAFWYGFPIVLSACGGTTESLGRASPGSSGGAANPGGSGAGAGGSSLGSGGTHAGGASGENAGGAPGGVGTGGIEDAGGGTPGSGGVTVVRDAGMGDAGKTSPCSLSFVFTPLDNQGTFSPRNVSAVWVTDAGAAFVKTLEIDGLTFASRLGAWLSSGGSGVDAVSGATNSSFTTHHTHWDCTDVNGKRVLSGAYTMNVEFATDNRTLQGLANPLLQVPFHVASVPETLTPPNASYFADITLTYR